MQPIHALHDVSLSVEEGEFISIMGASGAGKSTLLYVLGCLDRPTSGRYWFGQEEISGLSDRELSYIRATQMGFVFQTFNLLPHFDVLDNVKVPFLYSGTEEREAHTRAREAVRSVGLEDRSEHFPSELSGGELQRTAIARALAVGPKLLLADEPTGNLDSETGDEILAIFKKLNGDGMTILLVTHNPDIADYAHRTIHMKDGRFEGDSKT